MTNNTDALAIARAAQFVADWNTDEPGFTQALVEARQDGQLAEFAIALGVRVLQLTADLYGEDAQAQLDGFAIDALWQAQEGQPRPGRRP